MTGSPPQLPDSDFEALVLRAGELTRQFEGHPNSAVREDVLELLQTVDAIHRKAIFRLVELMVETGNHDLIHRAGEDPRIGTLFQLYDVMPLPELLRWQETLDCAREELKVRNAYVELLQVTDDMPHLRITGGYALEESDLRLIVQDAITAVFGPMQSLRWELRARPPAPAKLIPISAIQPAKRQSWVPLTGAAGLKVDSLMNLTVRKIELVLCRAESGYYAFPNACPGTALPLHLGQISGDALLCPWHSCAFELKTGKRVSGAGLDLKPLTLRLNAGAVEMGVWE